MTSRPGKLLLGFWVTLCLLGPAHHVLARHLGKEHLLARAVAPLRYLPPFQFRWGMFTDLLPEYAIPVFREPDGSDRIAVELLQTPSPLHKRSRVVPAVTHYKQLLEAWCRQPGAQRPLDFVIYWWPHPQGTGATDWPLFNQKDRAFDVCSAQGIR